MNEIVVERQDSNSEDFLLAQWLMEDGAEVGPGTVVCVVETQKTVLEVSVWTPGVLVRLVDAGKRARFNQTIGAVVADAAEARGVRESKAAEAPPCDESVSATRKARQLAERHRIDLADVPADGIVGEREVLAYLEKRGIVEKGADRPGELPTGSTRVLVIGAGLGAMQVVDILLSDPTIEVAGCVDDDVSLRDVRIFGVPVLGSVSDLERLWNERRFEKAIVSVSHDVSIRRRLFETCKALGIPMANAIDPSSRIQRGAVLGEGNVVCAHCQVGVAAVLGDNNFLSAYNNVEHHNRWGSHISTGPGCLTSSRVRVGDMARLGTGIHLEPGATIGEGAVVASGTVFGGHLPARHILKTTVRVQIEPIEGRGRP